MLFALLLLAFASITTLEARSDQLRRDFHWAVLVAGSNGWFNYRHQADVCHAYQILIKNGMPAERIITMMYDDIAHHEANPFPGKIFNTYEHIDVYEGVKIDYRGNDVNPENFIGILLGDQEMKKTGNKVLESTSQDNVFIYFADHGSDNLICFPNDDLYASKLQKTLLEMHARKRYNKLVFYLEACESGSMFAKFLPSNISVFATTAANPIESSYAAFCNDEVIDVCLADEYSINWMCDSDKRNLANWTLQQQFQVVKNATKKSHVQMYGDMKMKSLMTGIFQGQLNESRSGRRSVVRVKDFVDSRKVHIHHLLRKLKSTNNVDDAKIIQEKLSRALKLAEMVDRSFDLIGQRIKTSKPSSSNAVISIDDAMECYESAVKRYTSGCFTIQKVPEVARRFNELWTYCKTGFGVEKIVKAINYVCH